MTFHRMVAKMVIEGRVIRVACRPQWSHAESVEGSEDEGALSTGRLFGGGHVQAHAPEETVMFKTDESHEARLSRERQACARRHEAETRRCFGQRAQVDRSQGQGRTVLARSTEEASGKGKTCVQWTTAIGARYFGQLIKAGIRGDGILLLRTAPHMRLSERSTSVLSILTWLVRRLSAPWWGRADQVQRRHTGSRHGASGEVRRRLSAEQCGRTHCCEWPRHLLASSWPSFRPWTSTVTSATSRAMSLSNRHWGLRETLESTTTR